MIFTKQLRVNGGMHRSLPILVLVFVGLSVFLTLAFAGWREWVAREEQVREIQRSLANLASALTQHVEDTIQSADTTLVGLVERLETDGTTPPALVRLNRVLAARVATEPRFSDIHILGPDGNRIASSLLGKGSNNSDREYFRHHQDEPSRQAFIGPLIKSRSTGHWGFTVSRRLQSADGGFAGVALVFIDTSYFVDHYGAYDLGPHGVIALLTTGGTLLARSPLDEGSIGRVFSGVVFSKLHESPAGSYETTSVIDGVRRFGSYRQGERYPFVVVAAMSKDHALSAWRAEARGNMVIAAVLAGSLWLLGLSLIRQAQRGHTAEEQTRKSEARYRSIAATLQATNERVTLATDSGAIGLWEWDVTSDRMIWDAWMYRLCGMRSDEIPSYALWKRRLHPDDCPAAEQAVREALEGTEPYTSEFRIVWDDGSVHYIRGSGRVIRDTSGGVVRMIGANWDITEPREQAAESARQAQRLAESEARYRLLADNTSDAITCLDSDLKRTYVSPAYRTLFGYEPGEVVGKAMTAIVHPEDVDEIYRRVGTLVLGENDRTQLTYRTRHKQGHWIWTEGNLSLVRDKSAGWSAFMICSVRDISDRRAQADQLNRANTGLEQLTGDLTLARDQAERASQAKTRFLAGVSHELRTPLNGIMGYARLLQMEGGLNAAQSTRVEAMLGAGGHLLEIINCVLDLSQIEAGRLEIHEADMELRTTAAACLDLIRPLADAKRLTLHLETSPDVPRHVIADPTRLRQVLLNLLGNAVKFTSHGSVNLRLLTVADGTRLRLEVADTGPGIPTEQREQLFQEFRRLDTEASSKIEGAGLGLALCSRLAGLMGGSLGHEDNLGGGSVFWLELPLHLIKSPLPAGARPSDMPDVEPALEPAAPLHVLVVDDVLMNREIASSFLRAAGHKVTCVEGGAEAVAAVALTKFDVVLMDVRMPEMDGLEATRRIRALGGARARVPIVALTAQAFAEQIAECRKAGINSHLTKPFLPDTLLAAVVRAATAEPAHGAGLSTGHKSGRLMVAAPPVIGGELLVLDPVAFERTAALLTPEAVSSYLKTIAERAEALLSELREPDALISKGHELAGAAHALSGSAGLFGFERIAAVGRRFEQAVQSDGEKASDLADDLSAVIKATLQEIARRSKSKRGQYAATY